MDPVTLAGVIKAAQEGEASAYERLVSEYGPRVFGFLYRMCGCRADAEDLMQEFFLRVVRMLPAYRHEGRFEPWLFRIAANLGRDRLRRLVAGPKRSSEPDHEKLVDDSAAAEARHGNGVDAGLLRAEQVDALQAALSQLPEGEREVIMLRHFSEMSFAQIAETTGTPLGTALARSHRGLARLRKLMGVEAAKDRAAKGKRDR